MVYDDLDMRFITVAGEQFQSRNDGQYPPSDTLENAIEVITSEFDSVEDAVKYLYGIGAIAAGDLCYESYMAAHSE